MKALCERCLWLENGAIQALGEADEVIGQYLSATVQRESRGERRAVSHEIAEPVAGTNRYGDKRALIAGAKFVNGPEGKTVLCVAFRVCDTLPLPIVGFLVRNEKGETIFGSNTARENYPLPEMAAGDFHTVDFSWNMPPLTPGRYLVSVAVSEGTLDQFTVCDYVEDALAMQAPGNGDVSPGYLHLTCSGVSVYSEN